MLVLRLTLVLQLLRVLQFYNAPVADKSAPRFGYTPVAGKSAVCFAYAPVIVLEKGSI